MPMLSVTRRTILASLAMAAALAGRATSALAMGALPAPVKAGGMPLMDALALRRSTRVYSEQAVDEETLSTLLWAAFGINRPESGGHTAPSWHGSMETDIYVADAGGVRRYDPASQSTEAVLAEDIRGKASPQPFVGTAPLVLIYVADRARMAEAPDAEQTQSAHVDAAIVAQNVYLFCASAGLGTCLVGGADKPGLTALLKLPETQIVTFVQPLGHPKSA
jgi:nitroreductase